jgi:hypothetical protein
VEAKIKTFTAGSMTYFHFDEYYCYRLAGFRNMEVFCGVILGWQGVVIDGVHQAIYQFSIFSMTLASAERIAWLQNRTKNSLASDIFRVYNCTLIIVFGVLQWRIVMIKVLIGSMLDE